jgi:hypothetical protein
MYDLDSVILSVGNFSQLFLDNGVVEASQELTKTVHRPRRDPAGPLIKKDRPWEHVPYFTCSNHVVRRDSRTGRFKCWYEDLIDHSHTSPKWLIQARQCYAESDDGLSWTKPELDVVEEEGRRTNIVLGGREGLEQVHSCHVIEDPHPPEDSRRYRALFSHYPPYGGEMRAAHSPDGVHWTLQDEHPTFGSLGPKLGDVCTLHYDRYSRNFVVVTRHWFQCAPCLNPRNPVGPTNPGPRYPHDFAKQNRRRIWQSESPDMVHWGEPYLLLRPDDEEDNIDDGFYGMTQYETGNLFVGFLNVLHRVSNTMDVQLAFSRDRKNWRRMNKRHPWLPTGDPGSWDQGMVTICSPPIEDRDELLIYYGGCSNHHDYWMWGPREGMEHPEIADPSLVRFGLGLARIRKDGFVSFDAGPEREGLLVTRPLLSDGEALEINARCRKDGYIRVEVVDHGDELLVGRSRDDCDVFSGDSTAHRVTWKGDSTLPTAGEEFGGDTVYPWKTQTPFRKIRFFMKNAELYSFRFV